MREAGIGCRDDQVRALSMAGSATVMERLVSVHVSCSPGQLGARSAGRGGSLDFTQGGVGAG